MNYKKEVEKLALSDEQKKRIASAVAVRTKDRRAQKARTRRAGMAASLSLALALLVAAPAGMLFALTKTDAKGNADLPEPNTGDDTHLSQGGGTPAETGTPSDLPGRIEGAILTYEPLYAAGEPVVFTCRVVTDVTFKVEEKEEGFSVSYELLSSAPFAGAGSAALTEYTYRVELTAEAAGEYLMGGLQFTTKTKRTLSCVLYGYRPQEGAYADGRIFSSTLSDYDAFSGYLRFLEEEGEGT